MNLDIYLPIVQRIIENHPEVKASVHDRARYVLLLRLGRVDEAKAELLEWGYSESRLKALDGAQEGKPVGFEAIGNVFYITKERARQLLIDAIQQVALQHLDRVAKTP